MPAVDVGEPSLGRAPTGGGLCERSARGGRGPWPRRPANGAKRTESPQVPQRVCRHGACPGANLQPLNAPGPGLFRALAELELGELTTRGDTCLGEAVTQVERHGARRDPALRGDFLVRHTLADQLRDLQLHWRELELGRRVAFAGGLTGRAQFLGRPGDERLSVQVLEGLQCEAQVGAGVNPALRASQELPIRKMSSRPVVGAPQDGNQIATDLHTLLQRAHVPGPYVLAGHSFGGLYVLAFAARYPDDVAGMVLVDSTAPKASAKPRAASPIAAGSYDVMGRFSELVSTSARLGLGRLESQFEAGSLPTRSRDEVHANGATAGNLRSTIDEYVQANTSMEQAADLRDFADKPLVVLTAGSGSDAAHLTSQNHLATLSTNPVHRVIDGATHEALIAEEEYSAATTHAIRNVVSSVRSASPLVK